MSVDMGTVVRMTDSASQPPTHDGLRLYAAYSAPNYLRTARQMNEDLSLKPTGPVRAYVESKHGILALYQINEADLLHE